MHRAHVRRTVGVAALLPALLLAALYVAAPFAGTTTHAIANSHRLTAVVAAHAAPAAGGAKAAASGAAAGATGATGAAAGATAAASAPATAGSDGGGLAKAMDQPVHLTWAHQAIHAIATWYGAILAMAVIVLVVAAVRFARDRDDVTAED